MVWAKKICWRVWMGTGAGVVALPKRPRRLPNMVARPACMSCTGKRRAAHSAAAPTHHHTDVTCMVASAVVFGGPSIPHAYTIPSSSSSSYYYYYTHTHIHTHTQCAHATPTFIGLVSMAFPASLPVASLVETSERTASSFLEAHFCLVRTLQEMCL